MERPGRPEGIPQFDVRLAAPDLGPWLHGNTGIRGFTSLESGAPGPHVGLIALMHGNEIAGAIALDELLRAGLQPERGRLTVGFANLDAFERFDPRNPTASRFVDDDLNRIWDAALLGGARRSVELDRARAIRPLIDSLDVVLDLHSMLWPSIPLLLSGPSARGRALGDAIGTTGLVVSDHGHRSGPRLIDYPRFAHSDATGAAVLLEAGQHWQPDTLEVTRSAVRSLLRHFGMEAAAGAVPVRPRHAEVTQAVTADTADFVFLQLYQGGDLIAERNTLIALDGPLEIRTPHDDCLLIMPSLRPSRGHTAVRLARYVEPDG